MNELEKLGLEYLDVLNQQQFIEEDLDYSIFENQIPFLDQMAQVKGSGLTVFDLSKKEHIHHSYNLRNLFGYELDKIDNSYFDSRVHPDDLISLFKIGILVIKHSFNLPILERKNYKLQNEYRVLNAQNKYIRVIEQFQTLELDKHGNFWLALSTIDISPNQEEYNGTRSQWINLKTGEAKLVEIHSKETVTLSNRESEVLSFVKSGFLSKEISDKLSISLNTVNTHRQNILKKLGVNNSLEAVQYATALNLV